MREMGWTWAELEATPIYIRQVCAALISVENEVRKTQHDRAEREAKSGH